MRVGVTIGVRGYRAHAWDEQTGCEVQSYPFNRDNIRGALEDATMLARGLRCPIDAATADLIKRPPPVERPDKDLTPRERDMRKRRLAARDDLIGED